MVEQLVIYSLLPPKHRCPGNRPAKIWPRCPMEGCTFLVTRRWKRCSSRYNPISFETSGLSFKRIQGWQGIEMKQKRKRGNAPVECLGDQEN